jgi:hypothetical protein
MIDCALPLCAILSGDAVSVIDCANPDGPMRDGASWVSVQAARPPASSNTAPVRQIPVFLISITSS